MSIIVGTNDLKEAESWVRVLKALGDWQVIFFREKYPAVDGLVQITTKDSRGARLSNRLFLIQVKHRTEPTFSLDREDTGLFDRLPIPTMIVRCDPEGGVTFSWSSERNDQSFMPQRPFTREEIDATYETELRKGNTVPWGLAEPVGLPKQVLPASFSAPEPLLTAGEPVGWPKQILPLLRLEHIEWYCTGREVKTAWANGDFAESDGALTIKSGAPQITGLNAYVNVGNGKTRLLVTRAVGSCLSFEAIPMIGRREASSIRRAQVQIYPSEDKQDLELDFAFPSDVQRTAIAIRINEYEQAPRSSGLLVVRDLYLVIP